MNIKPEARVAATYDLFNDDVNSVVTLANGSAYAVEGEALDRFGMEFGASVTAEVNDNVELSLGYEGKFREDYQDHTGLINAKYKFQEDLSKFILTQKCHLRSEQSVSECKTRRSGVKQSKRNSPDIFYFGLFFYKSLN